MQRMQPQLKQIQNRYKEDKQRQQQELMKFYKENNINPLGSCLPLVAQIPVFISLFYMLRQDLRKNICPAIQDAHQQAYAAAHHISLKAAAGQTVPCGPHGGASFLFINDLTNKATGITLIVLLILYVGSQLASSLMMSSPMMDKTQRQLMMVLPLFFVVIVISFPAGLLVYWITTNLWTMGQQFVVRRMIGPPTPPVEGSGPGGGGGGPDGGGPPGPNGSSGGGIAGMLRGRAKPAEPEPAGVGAGRGSGSGSGGGGGGGGSGAPGRRVAPPPPPRKKKKRSGRRR
jgi:YidC/Oxa1 family membrane protein insertase